MEICASFLSETTVQENLVILSPFVQPDFGIIKGFGDRLREMHYRINGEIRKGDTKFMAVSTMAKETRGIITRFYCISIKRNGSM